MLSIVEIKGRTHVQVWPEEEFGDVAYGKYDPFITKIFRDRSSALKWIAEECPNESIFDRHPWAKAPNPKSLEVGKDYGPIFGVKDGTMIFNGGISWTARQAKREMTLDSQGTTDKALEYINRPYIDMGSMGRRR